MATQNFSEASLDADLKQWYEEEGEICSSDEYVNKFLLMIQKGRMKPNAEGKQYNEYVRLQKVAGVTGNYNATKASFTSGLQADIQGYWKKRFGRVAVEESAVILSRSKRGAFEPAIELAINSLRSAFNDATNYALYRSQNGVLGKLAAGLTGYDGAVTFSFATNSGVAAMQRVRIGTQLQFGTTKAGSVRTGIWSVTNVTDTGFQATNSVANPSMPSGSDYAFIYGDAQNGNTATDNQNDAGTAGCYQIAGLEDYHPLDAATRVLTFKGLPKTNVQAACGVLIQPGQGTSNVTAYTQAMAKSRAIGAGTTYMLCHPQRYAEVCSELQDQQRYAMAPKSIKGKPALKKGVSLTPEMAEKFSFDALAIKGGGNGDVVIVDDWACQYNVSWALDVDKYELKHTPKGWPFVRDTGGDWFRADGTSMFLEMWGIGEFICRDPGHAVVVLHDPAD